ncbi:WD40-like Beta Propeller Repeat [Filimonas lacunae]|uniref:WD40-like Beta Propeller Repeat n=1 Tax=Filimonas lacunae TaxID=477680 RepID=A0A173MLZ8_9BACT|nr:outer membrane lipoprotein omp16 precursor [Filimonas lacunae]SIT33525.1 WD40-like Beta Propeller Repeat [Filimonas lacunae]
MWGMLLLATGNNASAQSGSYIRKGDLHFENHSYYEAAQCYEKFLNPSLRNGAVEPYVQRKISYSDKTATTSKPADIWYKLGECYLLLNMYTLAEKSYRQAIQLDSIQQMPAFLKLAVCEWSNGKLADAEKHLNQLAASKEVDASLRNQAAKALESLQWTKQQLQNSEPFATVSKLNAGSNFANGIYAPFITNLNGQLVFTAISKEQAKQSPLYINGIYAVQWNDSITAAPAVLQHSDEWHYGTASFTSDGKYMYLTAKKVKGTNSSCIMVAIKDKQGNWSTPVALNAIVNVPGYNSMQPFINAEGNRLLFSSNQPGGIGGNDLWMADIDAAGKVVKANNLGSVINTPADEEAPFYQANSQTLVFASNGRIGMGGFDLYSSKGEGVHWQTPVNLGYPVNSLKNDIYFFSNATNDILQHALISSDRESDCCLQLYAVTQKPASVKPAPPVAEKVPVTPETPMAVPDTVATPVTPEQVGLKSVTLEMAVRFAFNKSTLDKSGRTVLDSLVQMMKEDTTAIVDITGHTDAEGAAAYNLRLSRARVNSCLEYLKTKGIDTTRVNKDVYGDTRPVAANKIGEKDNPTGRQENRRVEIKVKYTKQ